MGRWFAHVLGLDNVSGMWYAFWSGFGGDLTLFGSAFMVYRRFTCHVDSPRFCWRPGIHPVDGTPYRACKKHHPTTPTQITAEHVADAHEAAQADGGVV